MEDRTWSYHLSAYESQKHRLQVVGHYKKHHYTPLRSRGPLVYMRSREKSDTVTVHTLQLHGQGFCGAYTIRRLKHGIRAKRLQKRIVFLSCFPAQISKHVYIEIRLLEMLSEHTTPCLERNWREFRIKTRFSIHIFSCKCWNIAWNAKMRIKPLRSIKEDHFYTKRRPVH